MSSSERFQPPLSSLFNDDSLGLPLDMLNSPPVSSDQVSDRSIVQDTEPLVGRNRDHRSSRDNIHRDGDGSLERNQCSDSDSTCDSDMIDEEQGSSSKRKKRRDRDRLLLDDDISDERHQTCISKTLHWARKQWKHLKRKLGMGKKQHFPREFFFNSTLEEISVDQSETDPLNREKTLNELREKKKALCPNSVRNHKYTLLTFLPYTLYEQFRFFFNLYFLLVALTQFFPPLKVGFLFTYIAPLAFVLTVTLLKEAYDDIKRWNRDREMNREKYERLGPSGFESVERANIRVGDFIRIHTNQRVPADCILVHTTEKTGASFIRTDQLDGETDWKLRHAVRLTQRENAPERLLELNASMYAEAPKKDIYDFIGRCILYRNLENLQEDTDIESLTVDNTLWADTVIASGTIVGAVVYTGKETRSAMNASSPSSKIGLLDLEINFMSKLLFLLMLGLAVLLVGLKGFYGSWLIVMFRFVLLFSTIIPISLRVNLDFAKTLYSVWIMRDKKIPGTVVRNSNIPEELGRIEYILSDKTGTLTRNEMDFKKLHLGSLNFAKESLEDIKKIIQDSYRVPASENVGNDNELISLSIRSHLEEYTDESFENVNYNRQSRVHLGSSSTSNHRSSSHSLSYSTSDRLKVLEAIRAIALCHNVTPVYDEEDSSLPLEPSAPSSLHENRNDRLENALDDEIEARGSAGEKVSTKHYQASSPDEVALVEFAESVGLTLHDRSLTRITLRTPCGSEEYFQIVHSFPFTSATKRMGIILRNEQSGEIVFYLKGADVIMAQLVQRSDWLAEECDNMAREGLRTLVFAYRILSAEELEAFNSAYAEAKASIQNRAERVREVLETMLEIDLQLIGISGVEDKLQYDVQASLENFRNAGIRIWMLTGDKVETAICIARSARLFSRSHNLFKLQATSVFEASEELDRLATLTGFHSESEGTSESQMVSLHSMRSPMMSSRSNNPVLGDRFILAPTAAGMISRVSIADTCLVVDGSTLTHCLSDVLADRFASIASKSPAVVCCRCSPTQKALVVELIRKFTRARTCAIGDGGNDVSMIQAADIGIGIEGKEGKQASLASDFSITQFSHSTRLLFWHGRNSYNRSARLAQFTIHRGLIIAIIQAVFSALFFFAALPIYTGWLVVGYATVFTMFPVFSLVLDVDVTDEVALAYPELYAELLKGRRLSMKTFLLWVMISIYQGGAIMIIAIILFEDSFLNIVGITFSALILTEMIMVAMEMHTFSRWNLYAILASLTVYVSSFFLLPEYFDTAFLMTGTFWSKTCVITLCSCVPVYLGKVIQQRMCPAAHTKLS